MPNALRAIVPMKPIALCKSRLASVLDQESRAALSLEMLQHVLRALGKVITPIDTLVVGGDSWVRHIAFQESASWLRDPGGDLNQAISYGVGKAFADGAVAALVLPGDLALLSSTEIDDMILLCDGLKNTVIAPASTDGGTNAILATRNNMISPSYGPNSFNRHMKLAEAMGTPVKLSTSPGLAFDLDTPSDFAWYQANCDGIDKALNLWRGRLCGTQVVSR